jgi:hypothetical protein
MLEVFIPECNRSTRGNATHIYRYGESVTEKSYAKGVLEIATDHDWENLSDIFMLSDKQSEHFIFTNFVHRSHSMEAAAVSCSLRPR